MLHMPCVFVPSLILRAKCVKKTKEPELIVGGHRWFPKKGENALFRDSSSAVYPLLLSARLEEFKSLCEPEPYPSDYISTFQFDQTLSIFYFFYEIGLGNMLLRYNCICIA